MKVRVSLEESLGKDHFVKVRGIIKDLVKKLEADAEAEATQKEYCDKEMANALSARDDAIVGIEEQTATIDKKKSEIADLVAEIEDLGNQIAALRKGLFEAEELRAEEKAENEKTLADAEEGLKNIKMAIKVLKEFYEGFIQFTPAGAGRVGKTVGDLAPDAGFDGEYGGNQGAAKGIFGFLEVIQSDFERSIKETEEAEEKAQSEHDEYKEETETDIEEKSKTKKDKEKEKEETEGELVEAQDELKG